MDRARLAVAVMAASLLASPASWGQGDEAKTSVQQKQLDGDVKEKLGDEEYAALLKKKLIACKKFGDCKPYLLEKKNKKNKKEPVPADIPVGEPGVDSPAANRSGERSVPDEPASEGERAASASPGIPVPTAAQTESARQAAAGRGERTMGRAAAAVETLRRTLPDLPAANPADKEPGAPGAGGPEPGSSAPDGPRAAPGSASPLSVPEMALAARTGYAGTFRDQGLKVGAGPRGEPVIQRADGSPAGAPELARLSATLRTEPAALTRRPDFFEAIPREKFMELKTDFASRPELRPAAFKDIALTDGGRDFRWTASCSGLSGACNASAGEGSYRKGQYVPPEDLKKIWKAAHEEASEAEEEIGEYTEEDRRLAEEEDLAAEKYGSGRRLPANLSALLARMGDMARGLSENVGLSANSAASTAVSARVDQAVAGSPAAAGARVDSPNAHQPGDSPKADRFVESPKTYPPSPLGRRAAESRAWLSAAAAGFAFLLILLARRKGERR